MLKDYCLCVVLVGPFDLELITYSKSMTSQILTDASSVLRREGRIGGDSNYFYLLSVFPVLARKIRELISIKIVILIGFPWNVVVCVFPIFLS